MFFKQSPHCVTEHSESTSATAFRQFRFRLKKHFSFEWYFWRFNWKKTENGMTTFRAFKLHPFYSIRNKDKDDSFEFWVLSGGERETFAIKAFSIFDTWSVCVGVCCLQDWKQFRYIAMARIVKIERTIKSN